MPQAYNWWQKEGEVKGNSQVQSLSGREALKEDSVSDMLIWS